MTADQPQDGEQRGVSDALRAAVERTFASVGSAETRERAGDLLDEVARRGQEARDASSAITTRVVEAIQGMRLATGDDVRALRAELEALEERLRKLESGLDPKGQE